MTDHITTLAVMQSQYSHIRQSDAEWEAIEAAKDALDQVATLQAENAEMLTRHHTEICESGYDCVALGRLRSEIERLKAKVKQWKQVSAENFASCEKLHAALSRAEAERDAYKRALYLAIETHSVDPRQIERLERFYLEQA